MVVAPETTAQHRVSKRQQKGTGSVAPLTFALQNTSSGDGACPLLRRRWHILALHKPVQGVVHRPPPLRLFQHLLDRPASLVPTQHRLRSSNHTGRPRPEVVVEVPAGNTSGRSARLSKSHLHPRTARDWPTSPSPPTVTAATSRGKSDSAAASSRQNPGPSSDHPGAREIGNPVELQTLAVSVSGKPRGQLAIPRRLASDVQ